jgi:hypothetical protein
MRDAAPSRIIAQQSLVGTASQLTALHDLIDTSNDSDH